MSAAARELGIAQSAVSRHVASVERELGRQLFERTSGRLKLTDSGKYLSDRLRASLDDIVDICATFGLKTANRITIGCSHDVASAWLMPRLERMREVLSGLEIRLEIAATSEAFEHPDVDVSLRFGQGSWRNWQSVLLFGEEAYAVCAPSLMAKHASLRRLRSPTDLLQAPLLRIAPSRGIDWQVWSKQFGAKLPENSGTLYPTHLLSLQAASKGEGIALCWRWMHDGYLVHGRLQRLGPWSVKGKDAFHLLHRPSPSKEVRSLVSYLHSTAKETIVPGLA